MTVRKTGILKSVTAFLLALFLLLPQTVIVEAVTTEHNSDSGYDLILDDDADFLTDADEDSLVEIMTKITDYCNVALVTTTSHSFYSTEDFAADYFDSTFGAHASGTIFVIDRDLNEIYIYSDGEAHKTITNSHAYTITDNTYVYATESYGRDYYTCSYETMEQILALMEGRRIAQPMKYICSALLAIILALLINYFIAMFYSRQRKTNIKNIISGIYANASITNPRVSFSHQTKTYSPPSSNSGGGSSGGGGGGHSGGGGGHSI